MDDEEIDRLHEEHFLIKESLGGNLLSQDILSSKLQDGATVLDIGCGPGTWLLDLATEYPTSNFHGLDNSNVFPNMIKPPNVSFKLGDALDELPYLSNTFDLVQIRLMVAAFRSDEWDIVYRNVMRVLKPGGYIQVVEPDIRLYCERDKMIKDFSARVTDFLRKRNQDPNLIYNLSSIIRRNNFTIVMEKLLETPIGWGSTLNKIVGDDYIRGMKAAAPITAKEFNMNTHEYEYTLDELSARFAKAKAFVHTFICLAQKPSN